MDRPGAVLTRSDLQELVPIGGEVLTFHGAGHGPFPADAGGGVKERIAAHAAIYGVEGRHELPAADPVAEVEEISLVLAVGR